MAGQYKRLQRELALALCALPLSSAIAPPFLLMAAPTTAPSTQPGEVTPEQVEAMIQHAGTTPPSWWDSTPLNVPDEMDLSWKNDKQATAANSIRLYMLEDIFPNPDRWHEGVKLVQQSLSMAKDDPQAKANAENFLAIIYIEMLQDYARGAFWARKLTPGTNLRLAGCYLKMGCKPMALETLKKINEATNRDPALIKVWAEAGDLDKALSLVDGLAKNSAAGAYLNAGEACRMAGKLPQAITFYQKVLDGTPNNGENRFTGRATASLEAIKLYDALDLEKIADGTYTNESLGYTGPVKVAVVVKGHRIMSVKVTDHHEKRFFSSIIDTSGQIVLKQSVKGIDTTSGATITSEAIINASAKALAK